MAYVYEKGNQLKGIADFSNNSSGFSDDRNKSFDDYTYDANGNLKTDRNKEVAITYNHMNLPIRIDFGVFTGTNIGTIEYIYNADGIKIEKKVTQTVEIIVNQALVQSTQVTTTKYLQGFQYVHNGTGTATNLQFFPTAEGYVTKTGSIFNYVYNYTDHLGNVRLSYQDINKNGTISNDEILGENNYYAFGLKHQGYNDALDTSYKYKYNGKEYQDELNLNVTAMDFRQYDNATGRFNTIDALAEQDNDKSPYSFARNSPLVLNDPTGLSPDYSDGDDHDWNAGLVGEDVTSRPPGFEGGFVSERDMTTGTPLGGGEMREVLAEMKSSGGGRDGYYGNGDDRAGVDQRDDVDPIDVANGALGNYLFALDNYSKSNIAKVYNYGTRAISAAALAEANAARMLNISRGAQVLGNTLGMVTGAYTLTKTIEKQINTGEVDVKGYLDGSIGLVGGVAGTIVTFGLVSNPVGWGVIATGAAIYGIGSFAYDIYQLNK